MSKGYMKYDMQAALKNIRTEDGEKCPFKYNPPKFEKKKNENEGGSEEDKPKEKKFFNKFKKKKDNGPNPQMNDHEFRDPNRP